MLNQFHQLSVRELNIFYFKSSLQIKEVAAISVEVFDVSENIREKFFPDVKSSHLLKTYQSSLDFLIPINLQRVLNVEVAETGQTRSA